jgi:hypothetical protein
MSWPTITAASVPNLVAATVVGAGPKIPCAGCRTFGLQVTFTGAPSPIIVTLEASNDGLTWFVIGTWTTLATGAFVFVVDSPCQFIRSHLTTLTGGTNPTVSTFVTAV